MQGRGRRLLVREKKMGELCERRKTVTETKKVIEVRVERVR